MSEPAYSPNAKRLADEHWEWLESVLRELPNQELPFPLLKVIYISAFVHGYKHAKEPKEMKEK